MDIERLSIFLTFAQAIILSGLAFWQFYFKERLGLVKEIKVATIQQNDDDLLAQVSAAEGVARVAVSLVEPLKKQITNLSLQIDEERDGCNKKIESLKAEIGLMRGAQGERDTRVQEELRAKDLQLENQQIQMNSMQVELNLAKNNMRVMAAELSTERTKRKQLALRLMAIKDKLDTGELRDLFNGDEGDFHE